MMTNATPSPLPTTRSSGLTLTQPRRAHLFRSPLTVIVAENCFSQIFAWCDQSWNQFRCQFGLLRIHQDFSNGFSNGLSNCLSNCHLSSLWIPLLYDWYQQCWLIKLDYEHPCHRAGLPKHTWRFSLLVVMIIHVQWINLDLIWVFFQGSPELWTEASSNTTSDATVQFGLVQR
jgi:hypothetical protein